VPEEAIRQQEDDQLVAESNQVNTEVETNSLLNSEKVIQNYDFRSPNRVSKDQLKSIRTLHENFSEIYAFFLASKLQTMTTVDIVEVNQLRYSEYMLSLKNPSCFHIFDILDTEGRGLLELSPELVMVIVDRILGGSGITIKVSRSITILEQKLISPLISQALSHLTTAWESVHQLNFKLTGFESNPDFVQIAPASEIIIVVSFEIKIEEDSFKINVCYPSFALEDVISKLSVQNQSMISSVKNSERSLQTISGHLNKTSLTVKALLGKTNINIHDLLHLQTGDVLLLNTMIESNLPIYVADRLKYHGRPGILDGNLALKITDILDE
jgi:flagellar motor switch protein FliM